MEDILNNNEKSDEELKQEFKDAVEQDHPEEKPAVDPFSTDALGNEPAEEHDSWSL